MDILTYNGLLKVLSGVVSRHLILKDFDIGSDADFAASRKYIYPMLYITPISGTFFKSEANYSYPVKEIKLKLRALDLVNKGLDNLQDIQSDTQQILADILTEINEDPYYATVFCQIVGDIDMAPLQAWSDEELSGWETELTFRLKNQTSYCGLPITQTPVITTPSLTYNQVVAVLKDIQERHFNLKSFGVGQVYDYAASSKPIYPSLWVTPKAGTYFRSSSDSYPYKDIQVELRVIDLVNKGTDNQDDAHSDCFQTLSDIIQELNEHPYYQAGFMSLVGDIEFEPLEDWSDEEVSGWMTTIALRLKQNTSYCALPMTLISDTDLVRQFDDSWELSFF